MAVSVASYTNIANWFVTTTPRSVTGVAWSAGDIVVVVGGNENANGTMSNPTNANLTFGAPKASSVSGAGAECTVYVWASAAAAGAQTGQSIASSATGGLQWGFGVVVLTGSPTGFANAIANLTEAAISRTVAAGSTGIYCAIDFNATNPPGKTPATGSGTAVERRDAGNTTNYAQYIATWEGMSAGTFSFGPNNYTSLQVAQCFIEITAPSGGLSATVNQTTETDTAQPVTRRKTDAIGQPTETDLAQPITRRKVRLLGQCTESDVAQPVARLKRKTLGQPSETDTAQGVTRLGAALGQAAETDTAQPITARKRKTLGQPAETDSAQPCTRVHRRTLGQPSELDIAQPCSRRKARLLGQAGEVDEALAVFFFDASLPISLARTFRIRAESHTYVIDVETHTYRIPPTPALDISPVDNTFRVRRESHTVTVEVP